MSSVFDLFLIHDKGFCAITSLTRVNIEPVTASDCKGSSEASGRGSLAEWAVAAGVDFSSEFFVECQQTKRSCSSLTTVQIGREYLSRLGVDLTGKRITFNNLI